MRDKQDIPMKKKSVLVVGGGPGGYVAAIRAAQLGADVTLVEQKELGGTCLNVGCIPTKCLLHAAELLETLREQGRDVGVLADNVRIDFPQVMKYKDAVSKRLSLGVAGLLKANQIRHIKGTASFVSEGNMVISDTKGQQIRQSADDIILAVGSASILPPIPGIQDNPFCIDSTGILSLQELPKSLIIFGAVVIGMDMSCAYAAVGTKITVIEALDYPLPMLDREVTDIGMRHLENMGVIFRLGCRVERIEALSGCAKAIYKHADGKTLETEAEKILVAVGRKANTESLRLHLGNIQNRQGKIIVDEHMRTNVPHVYAIGDCVDGYTQLAHNASAMGEAAAQHIVGIPTRYCEATSPNCVYIQPEAASVGLTEEQCREKKIDYQVGRFPMNANGKALIINNGEGMVKVIADKQYGEILGVHIIGPRATDLIAEAALAIGAELTLEEVADTIHAHPTVAEAVREGILDTLGRAVHIPPKKQAGA